MFQLVCNSFQYSINRNLNKWKKQQAELEQKRKNELIYEKIPDVSPLYYRTADPTTGEPPKMVSGLEERDKK
jgi:hypothetical protein